MPADSELPPPPKPRLLYARRDSLAGTPIELIGPGTAPIPPGYVPCLLVPFVTLADGLDAESYQTRFEADGFRVYLDAIVGRLPAE